MEVKVCIGEQAKDEPERCQDMKNYGTLGIILFISRMCGIAPYSSLSTLQISRGYVIYGRIIATITTLNYLLTVSLEMTMNLKTNLPYSALQVVGLGNNTIVLIIVLFAIFTSPRRLMLIKQILQKLNQIKISLHHRTESTNKKDKCLLIIFLIVRLAACITDCTINFEIYRLVNDLQRYGRIIFVSEYLLVFLLTLLLSHVTWSVVSSLVVINNSLENLISEQKSSYQFVNKLAPKLAWHSHRPSNLSTNPLNGLSRTGNNYLRDDITKQALLQKVRQLNKHYSVICDIVRESTEADGVTMILIIIYFFFHLEFYMSIVFFWKIFTPHAIYDNFLVLASSIYWVIGVLHLITFAEPFHRTHTEMQRTIILVNSLKSYVIADESANNEVEIFQRVLLLNKATYTPLHMCTINRSLVFKVLGGVATYSMIVLTYGPEIKEPSLILNVLISHQYLNNTQYLH